MKYKIKHNKFLLNLLLILFILTFLPVNKVMALEMKSPKNWEELKEAIAKGESVKLKKDIHYTGTTATIASIALKVPKDKTVTIDLNGYTINRNLLGKANSDYNNPFTDGYVIEVAGTLILEASSKDGSGRITGGYNDSIKGGGVYINNGSFIMNGGNISYNVSYYGGGVSVVGKKSSFTMNAGNIHNNSAILGGSGGGVNIEGGRFNFAGGAITKNNSQWNNGGGLHIRTKSSIVNMTGGLISSNFANVSGGGVYLSEDSTFNLYGGSIINNGVWNYQGNNTKGHGAGIYLSGRCLPYEENGNTIIDQDNARLNIKGTVIVKDNYSVNSDKSKKIKDNVYLQNDNVGNNKVVLVTGELKDSEIWITTENSNPKGLKIAEGSGYTIVKEEAEMFFSDYFNSKCSLVDGLIKINKEEAGNENPGDEEPSKEEPGKENPSKEEPGKEEPSNESPSKEGSGKETDGKKNNGNSNDNETDKGNIGNKNSNENKSDSSVSDTIGAGDEENPLSNGKEDKNKNDNKDTNSEDKKVDSSKDEEKEVKTSFTGVWIAIVVVLILVAAVGTKFYFNKKRKENNEEIGV